MKTDKTKMRKERRAQRQIQLTTYFPTARFFKGFKKRMSATQTPTGYCKIVILISASLYGVKNKPWFQGAGMTIPNLVYRMRSESPVVSRPAVPLPFVPSLRLHCSPFGGNLTKPGVQAQKGHDFLTLKIGSTSDYK